jgi:hypothetical protein
MREKGKQEWPSEEGQRWSPEEAPPTKQLREAPAFSRDRSYGWSDRDRERELHDYYGASYYW